MPEEYERFVDFLMKTERCLREELKAVGIQIKLVDEASLILLWLEDDQRQCIVSSHAVTSMGFLSEHKTME